MKTLLYIECTFRALALNCNTNLDESGGEAVDWKAGKPVRVVRNYKLGKHSKYCPKEGNRYDGIYKVIKYYPEKGKSGFLVWRYLLRRDDPTPPPWSEDGQELDVIYPPGYLEAQASKENNEPEERTNLKRKNQGTIKVVPKRPKLVPYELNGGLRALIESDVENEKSWKECMDSLNEGKNSFLAKVGEVYMCICCQEIVYLPITTPCKHNICKKCLERSFASEIYTCPHCRFDLGIRYKMIVNSTLSKILLEFFPGYEATRN